MEKKLFPGLNLIKIVAAVGIVCHHYYLSTEYGRFKMFNDWGILVELFFMMSGFLMMNSYNDVKKSCFKDFFIKKASRIFPLTIVTVLVMTMTEWIYYFIHNEWITVSADFWNVLTSITLSVKGGGINNIILGINNPIWYLCVLLYCYIIFFIIVRAAVKLHKSVIYGFLIITAIGCGIMSYPNINLPWLNPNAARGYAAFFAGCILYIALDCVHQNIQYVAGMGIVIFVIPAILGKKEFYYNWYFQALYILFPLIITLFTKSKIIEYLCNNKLISVLGGLSFEIYLWHSPITNIMFWYMNESNKDGISKFIFLGYFCVVLLVSGITYFFIEKRINSLFKERVTVILNRLLEK